MNLNAIFNTPVMAPVARFLLGLIFVIAGYGKIGGYEATQGYMSSMGVMPELLPLVIAVELIGGILLIIGYQSRLAALALAGFTLIAGLLFHFDFADQMQQILFMKNLAITGGLLMIVNLGPGAFAIDNKSQS